MFPFGGVGSVRCAGFHSVFNILILHVLKTEWLVETANLLESARSQSCADRQRYTERKGAEKARKVILYFAIRYAGR